MPNEEQYEDEEVEPQPEFRESSQIPQVHLHTSQKILIYCIRVSFMLHFEIPESYIKCSFSSWQYYLLSQMGAPDSSLEQRETENDSLKRELEVLKPELQLIKSEVRGSSWCRSGVIYCRTYCISLAV